MAGNKVNKIDTYAGYNGFVGDAGSCLVDLS